MNCRGEGSVAKMAENKMEQYCKLPIPITAYQTDKEMDIETLEGTHHASVGDWIITGVKGEQYPCKPDIFAKTYIKYGQANKMQQVAAMFGRKLGELFRLKWGNVECLCEFTARGLRCYPSEEKYTYSNNDWLYLLLIGEAVITNE